MTRRIKKFLQTFVNGRLFILLVILALLTLSNTGTLPAQGPELVRAEDRDRAETIHLRYYVDEEDEGYSLRSEKEVEVEILSERGAEKNVYWIYESFFRTVDDVDAEHNGRSLDDDNIAFRNLERQDLFISDDHAYVINFPNVSKGDILEYSYEAEYSSTDYMPVFYVSNYHHLKEYVLTIEHPENLKVDFDVFMPQREVAYTVQREEEDVTVLRFGETDETEGLAYYPYDSFHAAILVRLRDASGKLINPVELNQFSEWYWNLFDFDVSLTAGEEAALEDEMLLAQSPVEKARVIYDWVRKNVRYVADETDINAIVPRPPAKVFDRRWGDCKDKGFLCAALGKKFGVEILPVLVSTRKRPQFDGIHLTQFNHVINVVEDGGKRLYFDPTYRYGEFGTLPPGDIGADGMILNRSQPERVTVETAFDGVAVNVTIDANLDSLESGRAQIVLSDTYLARAQYARTELTGYDLENYLSNMLTGKFRKLSLDYFEYAGSNDSTISFTAKADLSKLVINSRTKTYLPKVPFGSIDNDILDREKDGLELYFGAHSRTRLTVNLTAPGMNASGEPLALGSDADKSWMSAELETTGINNTVTATYEYARTSKIFKGQERNAFLEFCRELLKSKKDMFVLQSKD